ncbi:MAG TPA: oligopeptidase A [Thiotrichales bacterium]|nr:oligopeptidase A [Thiotrichales bacterium]
MSNPLLETEGLPPFPEIRPEHIEPAIDTLLADNRARLEEILQGGGPWTWHNLVEPLEEMEERLSRAWSPVSHLNSVMSSDALREAYNACLPKLSDYATEMGQNRRLYEAFRELAEGAEFTRLDPAQRKVVENALRDFRLSGVALPEEEQREFKEIMRRLSELTARFEENLLDATHGWRRHVTDEGELAGLPESARALARQTAEREGLEGWLFTLEFPSYYPVLTYADDRELRREMYTAYVTRASDEGPNAGRWDNGPLMEEILDLRHRAARLLGFANYAERSLATKMARSPEEVLDFLHRLAERSLPVARREMEELRTFASETDGVEELEAWDTAYYAEKLRQRRFDFSEEELRPWFPVPKVIDGMFEVVKRLYGLEIVPVEGVAVWHPDVHFYEIRDRQGEVRGQFYLDLYARPKKRSGAWMDECVGRARFGDHLQIPVAYLTCNFTPPVGNDPSLLTHDEVQTLFHEFGHGLHHMLTRVDYPSVSGISGVAWDAVELPSQFMENWCWEREALDVVSGHYRTGEPLPEAMLKRMLAARNFHAALGMVRQIEFALFDFRLHLEYDPRRGARIYEILREVRDQVAVIHPPSFNRFPHSFSHIFAGGYAAGYYSYKWAEVLSADAFSAFEEKGVFDRETGERFLQAILEQGGSRDPMELFVEFRGREPTIDALLRHTGLAA